jgi:hypothetical protein
MIINYKEYLKIVENTIDTKIEAKDININDIDNIFNNSKKMISVVNKDIEKLKDKLNIISYHAKTKDTKEDFVENEIYYKLYKPDSKQSVITKGKLLIAKIQVDKVDKETKQVLQYSILSNTFDGLLKIKKVIPRKNTEKHMNSYKKLEYLISDRTTDIYMYKGKSTFLFINNVLEGKKKPTNQEQTIKPVKKSTNKPVETPITKPVSNHGQQKLYKEEPVKSAENVQKPKEQVKEESKKQTTNQL